MEASHTVKNEKSNIIQLTDGYLSRTPWFAYLVVSLVFPMWGMAASLNDILITQFKTVFVLSDTATAFVQSAFYGGYFLIAIPASLIIKKTSYKFSIMIGLTAYIIGAGLFFPASRIATYSMFLVAIFAIAVGLSFLETSCDTYSSMLGPKKHATLRLNFSQTLVPLGDIAGILFGKYLIFGSVGNLSEKMAGMHGAAREAYGEKMLQLTLQPYKYILMILLVMLILVAVTRMPKARAQQTPEELVAKKSGPTFGETIKYLASNFRFKKGILAQFIYVGIQTTVWSFTIRLALNVNHHITDASAATFMVYAYVMWFVGKIIANFLLARFRLTSVLIGYSAFGTLALAGSAFVHGMPAVYMAIAASFFFGPQWPTIFAHTLDTVKNKRYTETAGAVVVMAIVGGAVVPAIQGFVSDITGSMQFSFIVPMIGFLLITGYFWSERKYEKEDNASAVEDLAA